MVDALHLEAGVQIVPRRASSACSTVPLTTRLLIQDSAWPSVLNTPGSVSPPRSRMTTTNLRLPDWCLARRRSTRSSAGSRASRSRQSRRRRPRPRGDRRQSDGPSFPRPSPRAACGRARKRTCSDKPEIAAQRQHALALHLVAEDGDGREVAAQRQLAGREQRA